MLEKDCNGNPISTFPPCYAFQMIFSALAPKLIQSISRNVRNRKNVLKRLWRQPVRMCCCVLYCSILCSWVCWYSVCSVECDDVTVWYPIWPAAFSFPHCSRFWCIFFMCYAKALNGKSLKAKFSKYFPCNPVIFSLFKSMGFKSIGNRLR